MEVLLYVCLISGLVFFIAVPTWFICSGICYKKKIAEERKTLIL